MVVWPSCIQNATGRTGTDLGGVGVDRDAGRMGFGGGADTELRIGSGGGPDIELRIGGGVDLGSAGVASGVDLGSAGVASGVDLGSAGVAKSSKELSDPREDPREDSNPDIWRGTGGCEEGRGLSPELRSSPLYVASSARARLSSS